MFVRKFDANLFASILVVRMHLLRESQACDLLGKDNSSLTFQCINFLGCQDPKYWSD